MEVNDFSSTTDLYQIVSNIYKMQDVPFGMKPVILLVASTLIPFISRRAHPFSLTGRPGRICEVAALETKRNNGTTLCFTESHCSRNLKVSIKFV
jgi:hypothetical protein